MNEVSCQVFPVLMAAFDRAGIETGSLFEGLSISRRDLVNPKNRIGWNEFAEIWARSRSYFTDEALFALGREFIRRPEVSSIQTIFNLAVTPRQMMYIHSRWAGPYMFRNVRSEVTWLSKDHCRAHVSIGPQFRDCPEFFKVSCGAFEQMAHSMSTGPSSVNLQLGERHATYEIRFSGANLVARSRKLISFARTERQLTSELVSQRDEINSTLEALRESEERYRQLVDRVHDIIWQYDPLTRRFSYLSKAACEITGYRQDEIMNLDLREVMASEDWPAVRKVMNAAIVAQSESFVVEARHRRKDGTYFWGEVHGVFLRDSGGTITGIHGVTRDVTARKEAEEVRVRALVAEAARAELEREVQERRRVEAELIAAKEQAESSVRLKASILANLSHEIRTPLTALIGFSQLLGRRFAGTEHEAQLRIIQNSGKRLLNLLNNMLDLARLDADKFSFTAESYPISQTVKQVVELLRIQARDRGLALTVDLPPELLVQSDPRRDEQVLLNIVGNAIRFTELGGIRITGRTEAGNVVLSVTDTGIGISEEFLPLAFQEFRQESEGLNRRHEGSGLGLALSKKLIELAGGSIQLFSTKGKGTTVEIRLPRGEARPAGGISTWEQKGDSIAADGLRFLVVEDDVDCQRLISTVLEDAGKVVSTGNSEEALSLAQTGSFDAAMIDINLKGSPRDGFGLLQALRSEPGWKGRPIAALTAFAMPGDREKILAAGFDAYLPKPLDLEQMAGWLRSIPQGRL